VTTTRNELRQSDTTKKFTHGTFFFTQTFWSLLHVLCSNVIRIINICHSNERVKNKFQFLNPCMSFV
jgi:hypothetical protein